MTDGLNVPNAGITPDGTTEARSEELATQSLLQINRELAFAVQVLTDAGFEAPLGASEVPADVKSRLNWNIGYLGAAKAWIEADPTWERIGGAPRFAVDLIEAGVGVQIAWLGVQDGRLPITSAVALHGASIVFGALRIHLREWIAGRPQSLAAQRERAGKLKKAEWYPFVQEAFDGEVRAGTKIEAVVALTQEILRSLNFTGPVTDAAIREKAKRVRRQVRGTT